MQLRKSRSSRKTASWSSSWRVPPSSPSSWPARVSTARAWPTYPLHPGTTYVNIGFWGTVVRPLGHPDGTLNRAVEGEVTRLGGHKSLYSDAYYDEATFADLYNTSNLTTLRAELDPAGRLPDLYDKAVRRR